mmetsp:Transcript_25013/g.69803  ORF Transcript_25013/g.69803 Transcript_25013/m.69803 type:complete len:640 (+) Transcript_25013:358-2277(+)
MSRSKEGSSEQKMWTRSSDNGFGLSLRRRDRRSGGQDEDRVLQGQMPGAHVSTSQTIGSSQYVGPRSKEDSLSRASNTGAVQGALLYSLPVTGSSQTGSASSFQSASSDNSQPYFTSLTGAPSFPGAPCFNAAPSLEVPTVSAQSIPLAQSVPLVATTCMGVPPVIPSAAQSVPLMPTTMGYAAPVLLNPAVSGPGGLLSRVGSSSKDSIKVLCSYGGQFVETASSECGKVYHGGTTRLITVDLPSNVTLSQFFATFLESGIAADLGVPTTEDLRFHYELPGEQGMYVCLVTEDDLMNMYEELAMAQVSSGTSKKLRVFVDMEPPSVSGTPPASEYHRGGDMDCSEAHSTGSPSSTTMRDVHHGVEHSAGTEAAEMALHGDEVVEPVHMESSEQECGGSADILKMVKGRMEIIPKSDIVISKLLGSGGYGEVYLGKWRDATDVAVKCLSPSLLSPDGDGGMMDPNHVIDLIDEAGMLFSLRHPNVVWVYGIVLEQPGDEVDTRFRTPAIIGEFMASGSLRVALSRHDPSLKHGWVRVVVALDAARGLEYLHSKHIVHFDLKSGNLLMAWRDRRPTCKVADFGLSKQRRQTYVSGVKPHTGTLPWMAPEILISPDCVGDKVHTACCVAPCLPRDGPSWRL